MHGTTSASGGAWRNTAVLAGAACALAACAGPPAPTPARLSYARPPSAAAVRTGYEEVGYASWYGDSYNGRRTASGERFDMSRATAAHPSLPLLSEVEVTNLENGRSLRVRVNDRSPRHPGRVIDLSRGAAEQLGFVNQGLARVRLRYLGAARPARVELGALEVRDARPGLDLESLARDLGEDGESR